MTSALNPGLEPRQSASESTDDSTPGLETKKHDTPLTDSAVAVLINSGAPIPDGALPVLIDVLTAFEQGRKVRIVYDDDVLPTTQAAQELGVSRPFLVSNLLSPGVIPFHMVGSQKRVLRRDLDAYMAERARRDQVLTKLTQESQELGTGYDY